MEFLLVGGEVGTSENEDEDPAPTKTCYTLDLDKSELLETASMSKARIAHAVCYLKQTNGTESVFAIGGFDAENEEAMDSVERYDI